SRSLHREAVVILLTRGLVNAADYFATDVLAPGLSIGHQTARCRHYIDTQPAEDLWYRLAAGVHPASRLRHALHLCEDLLTLAAVAQVNANRLARALAGQLVVVDEALFLEDARDLQLHVGGGHVYFLVLRRVCVSYAGQHICYWIGHHISCEY